MKFSNETITILKNFGNINPGIFLKTGNKLRTISPQGNILAEAVLEETIPVDFGIYDLNNFLSVVSLHKETPSFDFDDKHVVIVSNDKRSKIKYRFCEPTMLIVPPDKNIKINEPEINFTLTVEDFSWILKTASVLSSPEIVIKSDGEKVTFNTMDVRNDAAHTDALDLCDGDGSTYSIIFKTENLSKILMGSYEVIISSKGISNFINQDIDLQYFMSIETGSTYQKS